jgi:hypothetical protein
MWKKARSVAFRKYPITCRRPLWGNAPRFWVQRILLGRSYVHAIQRLTFCIRRRQLGRKIRANKISFGAIIAGRIKYKVNGSVNLSPLKIECGRITPTPEKESSVGGSTEVMRLHYMIKEGEETRQLVEIMSQ